MAISPLASADLKMLGAMTALSNAMKPQQGFIIDPMGMGPEGVGSNNAAVSQNALTSVGALADTSSAMDKRNKALHPPPPAPVVSTPTPATPEPQPDAPKLHGIYNGRFYA